jgi:hypothetical protein
MILPRPRRLSATSRPFLNTVEMYADGRKCRRDGAAGVVVRDR